MQKLMTTVIIIIIIKNSVALVRERTIPTERPPPVGEVSANICGYRGVTWSAQRVPTAVNLCFLDLEPLLLIIIIIIIIIIIMSI